LTNPVWTELAGSYTAHVLVATRAEQRGGAFSGGSTTKFEPMHIAGSPFKVTVKPGPTYPPACGVGWVSAENLVVGQPARLAIQSRDRFFNARDQGGDTFTVMLRSVLPIQVIRPPCLPCGSRSS